MKVIQVETKACTVYLSNKVQFINLTMAERNRTSKFRPHKYITYVTFDMVFPNGPSRHPATE